MKKTVNLNSGKTQVEFKNVHVSRDVDSPNYKENTHIFYINGQSYGLVSFSKRGKSGKFSTTYQYEGQTFPDSEKKLIEHILNNQL